MSTDKSERDALLPCPFCGNAPWGAFGPDVEGKWWVECHGPSGVTLGCADWFPSTDCLTRENVVAAWNTRPSQPATVVPVAAEKTAPVQGWPQGIPWSLHMEAYAAYSKKWRPQPALIEGGCCGGFHVDELDDFIPGWRDKVSEIAQLRAEIARLRANPSAPAESGWQWVPVEPTQEMIDALHDEIEHEVQTGTDQDGNYAEVSVLDAATLPAAYRSMLKAAPSAAQPGGEGGDRG
jgi:hypothetical protein